MTDLTRDKPQAAPTSLARVVAALSFVLGLSGALFWVPALFLPRPEVVSHDWLTFTQRVANVALQQYTPQMRPVVPVLGAFFTVVSLVQVVAAIGAWSGAERPLALLRLVSYIKIGLFVTSCLLLALAVFSPTDPPWTTATGLVASLVFVGIYYWMVRMINGILGDNLDPDAGMEDAERPDDEDDPE